MKFHHFCPPGKILFATPGKTTIDQASNQLGTPGGAKSFRRRAQSFWTMSKTFFLGGRKIF